ncbi:MFS transporter [Carboxydothermus islandicus]|nr:MFS transporter [Carboxydothermus islandicus]
MKNKELILLIASMAIIMVGFGVVIPILPYYVKHFQATSLHMGLLMSVYAIMQFIFSPLWGRISDQKGRKPIFLVGIAGFIISFILFGLAQSLWMLFAARIIGGVLSSATMVTAMAYIADTTTEDERAKSMGLMEAAMGIGMILGPMLGGFLSEFGLPVPFFFAAGMAFITFIFSSLFLKEPVNHKSTHRDSTSFSNAFSIGWVFYLLAFLANFAIASHEATIAFYGSDTSGLNHTQMGLLFTIMGIAGTISQGILVNRFIKAVGEAATLATGLIISALAIAVIPFSHGFGLIALFSSLFYIGTSLATPCINSLLSRQTKKGYGSVMGLLNSAGSLGRIIGPTSGGALYHYVGAAFPFWTASLLFLFASLLWLKKMGTYQTTVSTR